MMRQPAGVLVSVATAAAALTGCAPSGPDVVMAVGLNTGGSFGVVMACDQGRSLTHVGFTDDAGNEALSWVGRTVEPITFFPFTGDPPDNWVFDTEGGLLDGVAYRFEAGSDDLEVEGPQFSLADIRELGADEVIDADGAVLALDEFLEGACG